jgi:hypothetical protein
MSHNSNCVFCVNWYISNCGTTARRVPALFVSPYLIMHSAVPLRDCILTHQAHHDLLHACLRSDKQEWHLPRFSYTRHHHMLRLVSAGQYIALRPLAQRLDCAALRRILSQTHVHTIFLHEIKPDLHYRAYSWSTLPIAPAINSDADTSITYV